MIKTVTFCGHSSVSGEEVKQRVRREVEALINQGAREFLLGGYGRFDILCAVVVKELKEKYSDIESVLVLPYIDKEYNQKLYDCSEYPPIENVPKRFAIIKRNEYMVERADAVVCYVNRPFGGAAKTFEYAKRKKKNIINLAE